MMNKLLIAKVRIDGRQVTRPAAPTKETASQFVGGGRTLNYLLIIEPSTSTVVWCLAKPTPHLASLFLCRRWCLLIFVSPSGAVELKEKAKNSSKWLSWRQNEGSNAEINENNKCFGWVVATRQIGRNIR